MKKNLLPLLILIAVGVPSANAQYYNIINQATGLLQAPLSGSSSYKGFVEASFVKGIGTPEADFTEITTTQGFQYNSWFFMGLGLGVQLVSSHVDKNYLVPPQYLDSPQWNHSSTKTGCMIPLYTDFRFTPWGTDTGVYLDLRAGCSFLIGRNYLAINQGYLTSQEYFYFKPTLGVRVPISLEKPRQAIDFGVSYQLLTSNYWSGYNSNKVLSALGLTIGYEW